jgi:acyl carrier protein
MDMEFEKLREIIADVMSIEPDEITEDVSFENDLGADSLDLFQIVMGIEDAFDIEIETEEAEKIVTVGDAVEQIKNAVN